MKFVRVFALMAVMTSMAWSAEFSEDAAFPPDTEAPSTSEPLPPDVAPSLSESETVSPDTTAVAEQTPEATSSPEVKAAPVETPVAEAKDVEQPTVQVESESAPAPVSSEALENAAEHKVVRGDTLWDIAGAYLRNPFLWPSIFEANRNQINDPDLIYPDQQFVIPSVQAAAMLPMAEAPTSQKGSILAPTQEPAPGDESAALPPLPKKMEPAAVPVEDTPAVEVASAVDSEVKDQKDAAKRKSQAVPGAGFMGGTADTFVADKDWEYDGYVLRDRDQKMMISQGDVVFLNVGTEAGVLPKMAAHIYRVGQKIKDPFLHRQSGRLVKRVGTIIVTSEIGESGCTAVVTNSLEPIRIGDIVKFISR